MLKLHYDQFIKPSKEQNVCRHQPNQIKCTGNTLFINKTDSHKNIYPVYNRLKGNKIALTSALSLVCLEIRSRNEEGINSTRNRIYSLKVFYFLLYRRRYFLLVSELIQSACQGRPEIRLRSQAIRVYKYMKIQGPRFQRNYIIARDQKSDLHGTSFQSSPEINSTLITRPICIQ